MDLNSVSAQRSTPVKALSIQGAEKIYDGIRAVSDVSFSVQPGEVIALAGENGAGKSTIKNLLAGIVRPDAGEIHIAGQQLTGGVGQARELGLAAIHQELSLFPHLTVAENILISRLGDHSGFVVRPRHLAQEVQPLLDRVGASFGPQRLVEDLAPGERQLVEIAKALATHPTVVIFDEPTASLNLAERGHVMSIVEQLAADNVAVLYISHFLDEIFRLANRIVILRDGKIIETTQADFITRPRLESLMVGRELSDGYPVAQPAGERTVLQVRGLDGGKRVRNIDLDIREGEILGLAGLMGSGRTEVARALFGLNPSSGHVRLGNTSLRTRTPRRCIDAGMAFVTEDRRHEGLFLDRPIRENLTSAAIGTLHPRGPGRWAGLLDHRADRVLAGRLASDLGITARGGLEAVSGSLSGGNQQKIVIGRWLSAPPKLLIMDEPTRGIDVGAKAEVYRLLTALAARGTAILLISSEMEELLGLSHRVAVMHDGQLAGTLDRPRATQENIIRLATGGKLT
ncbi:sugar ABC transporter ATP-binding protein [Streptomyces sp. NPDC051976]|uniref:sugar ABC transporter ATP-binding protein n=1 Tax=Streptomyces sp. NPDC051976 TaxID=3154947 RepID=UPI003429D8C6